MQARGCWPACFIDGWLLSAYETQSQYTAVARNNQLVLILNSEIKLPEDAPVRVTSAQLEELD